MDERSLSVPPALSERRMAELPPSLPQYYTIQRRGARVQLGERALAQLQLRDVSLIDISLSGALVEHIRPVPLGEVYRLAFPVESRLVQLSARAIRAFVSHLVPVAGGEKQVVYRTGLEFVGVEKGTSELLSTYIGRQREQARAG